MPEIPDLTVYVEHLDDRVVGHALDGIRIASPFLLRSVSPAVDEVVGRRNSHMRARIEAERAALTPLPPRRAEDFDTVRVRVTSFGASPCGACSTPCPRASSVTS